MHVVLVVAHPDQDSFVMSVVAQFAQGLSSAGTGTTLEIADLDAEQFDPRFRHEDLAFYRGAAPAPPADVLREQARIDRADALVVLFPIYWWGMPALLKGWIDRVFTRGWAFDDSGGKLRGLLRDRPVLTLAVGGGDEGSLARHGYDRAMVTQMEQGMFAFSGLHDVRMHFLLDVESRDGAIRERLLASVLALGRDLADPTLSLMSA